MIGVFAIMVFCLAVFFFFPLEAKPKKEEEQSPKYKAQMKKLWQVAQTSMKEWKPSRAEKALLTILKFDEKNAAAYNRLGILYAKSQKYEEAVECFEIAQSLDNNPASIHNAGLIYLEIGEYEKAEMAFLQAISQEGDVPARYMALAKAEEKLGSVKKAIEALENAYELDPSVSTLRQILAIYESAGDTEAMAATTARIEERVAHETRVKNKRAMRAAALKAVRAKTPVARSGSSGAASADSVGSTGSVGAAARSGASSATRVMPSGSARAVVKRTPRRVKKIS